MTEPSAAADERPAPILVTRVDVDRPLAPVSLARADGTRYTHALLIFYRGGVPVAQHSAPVTGDEITTEQLEAWVPALPADRALPRPDDAPFISVVVPTVMQRGELLERSIGALAALDYPEFEVIVVDNRPDGTAERAVLHQRLGALPGVRVVSEAYPGISAARNRGVRDARGGIVAFTDDDAVTDPNWLWAFAARFAAEPGLACVTGPMLPAELETAAQVWFESSGGKLAADFRPVTYRRASEPGGRFSGRRYAVLALRDGVPDPQPIPVYRAKFGMGVNMAFRTDVLRSLGGFDASLGTGTPTRGGEDIAILSTLLYRGYAVGFEPGAVIHHYHRDDDDGLRTQMHGYGVGYTAAVTALVLADPWHVVGLGHLARHVLRVVGQRSEQRGSIRYPTHLTRAEQRGLLAGPLALLRSRRRLRRAARPTPDTTAPETTALAATAPPR